MHDRIAESILDELTKQARMPRTATQATLRGMGYGALGGALYGGLRGVVAESKKHPKHRRYGRAALSGALQDAPKGAAIGAAAGWGRHVYLQGKNAVRKFKRHVAAQGKTWHEAGKQVADTARRTAESVQNIDRTFSKFKDTATTSLSTAAENLRPIKDSIHAVSSEATRVLKPIGDSVEAMRSEGIHRREAASHKKPGIMSRIFRRKAGDFLAKGK